MNYENFNFQYSKSDIGKKEVEEVIHGGDQRRIHGDREEKILFNLGPPGAGKTHLVIQLAVQGKAFVLLYNCNQNAKRLSKIIEDIRAQVAPAPKIITEDYRYNIFSPRPFRKDLYLAPFGIVRGVTNKSRVVSDYDRLACSIQLAISNFALANALTLLKLVQSDSINPVQFLRFLEYADQEDVYNIFDTIQAKVKTISESQNLKNKVIEEINKRVALPVVEAWDELWDREFMVARDAADRIARQSINKTIFCGEDMLFDIAGVDYFSNVLKFWSEDKVYKNLSEDLNLSGVREDIMDTVTYVLQGRPQLTTIFKNQVYHVRKTLPDIQDINDIFFR